MENAKKDGIPARTAFRYFFAVITLLSLIYAVFFAPAGFFNTDEFIYAAMTENLVENGSLFFDNGYRENPSETLQLWFLNPGEKGLAPQYPSGYAFFAAPFFMLAGIRGIIIVNTLAALGIVWLTYLLADLLFEDKTLALNAAIILSLASFLCDYAFSIMPHATSSLCILSAVYYMACSVRKSQKPYVHAYLAGLCIGIGIHFRVDVILAAPLLVAWLFGSASFPLGRIFLFLGGLLPGLGAASWLNYLKFGSFNPLTYGSERGLTSFAAYSEFIPLVLVGILIVIALGFSKIQDLFLGTRGYIILGLGLAVFLLMPLTSEIALLLFKGLYVLLINLQSYDFVNRMSGHPIEAGKYIFFSGQFKKSLFESLPYAGFIILPLADIFRGRFRKDNLLLALIPFGWFAFYSIHQWHGGQSTNMRYFTPTLPFIAILTAAAWQRLRMPESGKKTLWRLIFVLPFLLAILALIPIDYYLAPISLLLFSGSARMLFYYSAIIALLILFKRTNKILLFISRGFMVIALVIASINGYLHDFKISYSRKVDYSSQTVECAEIEKNALLISVLPRFYYCHLLHSPGQVAGYDKVLYPLDTKLVDWNLDHNRPVYADASAVEDIRKEENALGYSIELDTSKRVKLYRIVRRKNDQT